jgi:ferredoxin-NADP reductase
MQTHSIRLKDKYEVADRTKAFVFEKPEGFSFEAGQYVVMTLPNLRFSDDRRGARSLSIASAPCDPDLVFAMRITESGFKRTLDALEAGDEVNVVGPVGHFVLPEEDARPVVFLIGGIGITPARSILRQASRDGRTQPFYLFCSNRRLEDAPFFKEMLRYPSLRYACIPTFTNPGASGSPWEGETGYIRQELLEKYVPDLREALYYIVGGIGFLKAMENMLAGIGIAPGDIRKDPFTGM